MKSSGARPLGAALIASCLTLACSTPGAVPPPPMPTQMAVVETPLPPSPAQALVSTTVQAVEGYKIARAYAVPGQDIRPREGELPNGVILLSRNATAANQAVCSAFASLADEGALVAAEPNANVISTYWLLSSFTSALTDCQALLASYDYDRASQLRRQYDLGAATGPGMVLIQSDGRYVPMDMSSLSPAQMSQLMSDWFGMVVREGVDLRETQGSQNVLIIPPRSGGQPATSTSSSSRSTASSSNSLRSTVGRVACAVTEIIPIFGQVIREVAC